MNLCNSFETKPLYETVSCVDNNTLWKLGLLRQVTATFSYRFGKQNGQQPQRRRNGSSQDEQNRVGGGGQQ